MSDIWPMKSRAQTDDTSGLFATWSLPYSATLGSSVRSKGIFLEVRSHLPPSSRKALTVKSRQLSLSMPADQASAFAKASALISQAVATIEARPVIPREIEDILSIKPTERHRWLSDGRLPSAGTRTVRLRGRARSITFHVFERRVVEDILDRDLVSQWREEDAERAAENRRRAAWKAKLKRDEKKRAAAATSDPEEGERFQLQGWAEFERESGLG